MCIYLCIYVFKYILRVYKRAFVYISEEGNINLMVNENDESPMKDAALELKVVSITP